MAWKCHKLYLHTVELKHKDCLHAADNSPICQRKDTNLTLLQPRFCRQEKTSFGCDAPKWRKRTQSHRQTYSGSVPMLLVLFFFFFFSNLNLILTKFSSWQRVFDDSPVVVMVCHHVRLWRKNSTAVIQNENLMQDQVQTQVSMILYGEWCCIQRNAAACCLSDLSSPIKGTISQ